MLLLLDKTLIGVWVDENVDNPGFVFPDLSLT